MNLPNGRHTTYWSVALLLAFVCLCALAQIETKQTGGTVAPAQATNALVSIQTNGVFVTSLATNLNLIYGTGMVFRTTNIDGSVDSHISADLSSIGTGVNTNLGLNTNSGIFSVQYEPNRGSLWYSGTNGIPTTNEARAAMEYNPFWRSLRAGEVAAGADINNVVGNGSNYWNNTNIGVCSVGFGSNAFTKGSYSSVLGGIYNAIRTNASVSVIGGGVDNLIDTNAVGGVIGGGGRNWIRTVGLSAGTARNVTIGGGSNNVIGGTSTDIIGSVIGGGGDNLIEGGEHSVISGGFDNQMQEECDFGFIGGGNNNRILANGATAGGGNYSTIAGGRTHVIRGVYGFIGGGRENSFFGNASGILADYNVIVGGASNNIGINNFPAKFCFIGGGHECDIQNEAEYSVVVGGRNNTIGASFTNSVIVGGANNVMGGNKKFAFIGGGERNTVTGNYGVIVGGASNNVTADRATAIGNNLTNNRTDSVLMGAFGGGSKVELQRATNASMGGTIISITTPVASAGAAETNLIAVTIPAHTLTNTGDRVTFRTSGRFAGTAENKDIKLVYGSEAILDTTAQLVNGGAWTFEGEIIRTGNTSQSVNAEFHGAGVTLFTTAASLDLVQTNGIATTLKVTSTAASDGAVTNRTMTIWLWPAP